MSKLYFRTTDTHTGYASGEQSTALAGTIGSPVRRDLSVTAGAAQTSQVIGTAANTNDQRTCLVRGISETLTVSSIDANTWTIGIGCQETNAASNAFLALSIYVLTSGDTVRGFIYDATTQLGTEWGTTEAGRVVTVSGAAVTGVVSTDRICVEIWAVGAQSMATSYNRTFMYNGATEILDLTTTTDAASYADTPQDLFGAPTVTIDGTRPITTTITATADATHPIDASVVTTATIAADGAAIHPIDASVSVTATITATASVTTPAVEIDATRATTATVTATMDAVHPIAATRVTDVTVAASASTTHPIDSAIATNATIAADMVAVHPIDATRQTTVAILSTADVVPGGGPVTIDSARPITANVIATGATIHPIAADIPITTIVAAGAAVAASIGAIIATSVSIVATMDVPAPFVPAQHSVDAVTTIDSAASGATQSSAGVAGTSAATGLVE